MRLPNGWKVKTAWLVMAFVALLVITSQAAWGASVGVSLGKMIENTDEMTGQVSFEAWDWVVSEQITRTTNIVSLAKKVDPQWCLIGCFYQKLGVAYVSGSNKVGNLNYQLAMGFYFPTVEFEYYHYSSAGINRVNNGLDGFLFRLRISLN